MAIASITNVVLQRNEAKQVTDAVAVDASLGAKVSYANKSDGKILLMITNGGSAGAKKATIVAGNSLQGTEDLVISVAQGKTMAIVVESGKYMNVSGDYKDCIVVKGESTDIKVLAIELP